MTQSKNESHWQFETLAIKAGVDPDPTTGAIMTPIYQTSTYVQEAPGKHKGYEYSRTQNPTRAALEENLAALEGGSRGLCFASGMAATDCVMRLLKPGDEVIATDDLYGGTYRIFTKVYEPLGIKFHFVPMKSLEKIEEVISDRTRMFWLETPTNPLLNVLDIQGICALGKGKDITCVVDNTFATPYLQQPLKLGADLVVHSVTKYLAGHSDVVMGAIVTKDDEMADTLAFYQNSCGAVPGPQDAFLTLRGIKTLHLRMQRHCENAKVVAEFLTQHDRVGEVFWPGFESHFNHDVAKSQMRDFGGMVSFSLKEDGVDKAHDLLQRLKIFNLAESLGGVESLAGHPATMTHASIPKEEREKAGLKDSLIRLSVGIESEVDLVSDLEQGLG